MKQHMMMIHKMIQYSYVDTTKDGTEDGNKMSAEDDPTEIDDEDV